MDDLEQKLKKSKAEIRMIATDGMFSADGDLAPLPEIVQLAERYEATVFVDDAHGTGILGENGRGTWEHFGLKDEIDIKVGSLAKAFSGGLGGFVTGSHDLCDYVRVAGGHYIFGGSIPPAIAMAITSNIRTARNEPWRRKKVIENSEYLRTELRKRGFGVLGDNSPIVPIVMGKSEPTLAVSKELMEAGFFIPTFRYPATPMNKARLRATLMATHTKEQIDGFIAALVEISEKNGICP
jgi:7-keto-8-aminopelargonate synthetase-like enzyme